MSVNLGPLHSVPPYEAARLMNTHAKARAGDCGRLQRLMNTHAYAARIVIVCLPAHDSPAASATGPRSRATAGSTQSM